MGVQLVGLDKSHKQSNKYTGQRNESTAELSIEEKIRPYILSRSKLQEEQFEAYFEAARKLAALLEAHGISEDDIIADFQRERQRKNPS